MEKPVKNGHILKNKDSANISCAKNKSNIVHVSEGNTNSKCSDDNNVVIKKRFVDVVTKSKNRVDTVCEKKSVSGTKGSQPPQQTQQDEKNNINVPPVSKITEKTKIKSNSSVACDTGRTTSLNVVQFAVTVETSSVATIKSKCASKKTNIESSLSSLRHFKTYNMDDKEKDTGSGVLSIDRMDNDDCSDDDLFLL